MSTTDWSKYLPQEVLPDTGEKKFKTGQVWASCVSEGRGSVYKILGREDADGYWKAKPLAGHKCEWLHKASFRARRSVLIATTIDGGCKKVSWDDLTDAQKADLISAASRAREEAIDSYQPRSGKPLNTLPAITEAVVRSFSDIVKSIKIIVDGP